MFSTNQELQLSKAKSLMLRQKSKLNKTVAPNKLEIILNRIEEMHFLTQQVSQEVLKQ